MNTSADFATPLRNAFTRYRTTAATSTKAAEEHLEATLDLAHMLYEARQQFPSDIAFGTWLVENDLDDLSKNDRAALLKIAQYPDLFRDAVASGGRSSLERIWREEMQPRVPQVRKADPTGPQDANTPESAIQPEENAEAALGTPDISVSIMPTMTPAAEVVASAQTMAQSPMSTLPDAARVLGHFLDPDARLRLGRIVTKRGHGRAVWALIVESIKAGAFGPPTKAVVGTPNLRLVLPWAPKSYAQRFDLFDPAIRTQIQRDILPLVVAHGQELADHPERLPELVRAAAQAHREEARRTYAVQRQAAAVAQLPITERPVLVYGHSLWPPPPPATVAWSYTEACEAAWFFRLFQQLFHHIESPASVAQTATMFLRWTPMRASGWAEAVRKIAWAYTEQPEGPCDIPPIPPNYGM